MDILKKVIIQLDKLMEPVYDWIVKHYNNPLLWVTLFVAGILIFRFTYDALNKDR